MDTSGLKGKKKYRNKKKHEIKKRSIPNDFSEIEYF